MSTAAARKAWNDAMKATAGATSLVAKSRHRRSARHDRRKAKRSVSSTTSDDVAYQQSLYIDSLEGVDPSLDQDQTNNEDEEYDELAELDGGAPEKTKRRAKKRPRKGSLPRRFLPRSLGMILLEEASRPDSAAHRFLETQAKTKSNARKVGPLCPVTGWKGRYRHGPLYYYNERALEQLRERLPPWMTLTGSTATFAEARSSLLNGEVAGKR